MTVMIVRSDAPDCGSHCAEWISAEGEIQKGTPALFQRTFKAMGSRKLPIFIFSAGGKVESSLVIGRMIRARGLDVAVSSTKLKPCAPDAKACNDQIVSGREGQIVSGREGEPVYFRTFCGSACVNILAAGTQRIVPLHSYLGVHEASDTETIKEIRKTPKLDAFGGVTGYRTKVLSSFSFKDDPPASLYSKLNAYFKEMGIKGDMIRLMHMANSNSVYWMTSTDIEATAIATDRETTETLVGKIDHPGLSQGSTEIAPRFQEQPRPIISRPIPVLPDASSQTKSIQTVRIAAPVGTATSGVPNPGLALSSPQQRIEQVKTTTVTPGNALGQVLGQPSSLLDQPKPLQPAPLQPVPQQATIPAAALAASAQTNPAAPPATPAPIAMPSQAAAPVLQSVPLAPAAPQKLTSLATPIKTPEKPSKPKPTDLKPVVLMPSTATCGSAIRTVPAAGVRLTGQVVTLISPAASTMILQRGEEVLHVRANPKYFADERVGVRVNSGNYIDQPFSVLLPRGLHAEIGDWLTFETRHQDGAMACHFVPNLALHVRHAG